jgi:hypothetical protein
MDSWPLIVEGFFADFLISVGFVSDSELLCAVAGVLFVVGGVSRQIHPRGRMAVVLAGFGLVVLLVALVWRLPFLGVVGGVLLVAALLVHVRGDDDRLPEVFIALGIVLATVAAVLARTRITHGTGAGAIVETRFAPEFWVAAAAAAAGMLALFRDRASRRRRQGHPLSIKQEPT